MLREIVGGIGTVIALSLGVNLVGLSSSKERRRKERSERKPELRVITEANVKEVIAELHRVFQTGKTRDINWRKEQLRCLKDLVEENRDALIQAVAKDLGKQAPYQEIIVSEINLILGEVEEALHHLDSWVKPTSVYTPIAAQPARSFVYSEPVGVVAIIAPWNYPVNLALAPLIGSIAAGNCSFVKASRHSGNTARVLCELIPKYLDRDAIRVEGAGGASFLTELLKHKFDHIVFTGSVSVGKVVAAAAAKYLTPCTLELGGKNPCIVADDADLTLAAKRIAFGKLFNAGQTCLGVDYVLVSKDRRDDLVKHLIAAIEGMYGKDPKTSTSLPRIISKDHVERLSKTFKNGKVVLGGVADVNDKYVSPTIIVDPDLSSPLMTDEIFGPVLPIITFDALQNAIDVVNERPCPLALYVFTTNSETGEKVIKSTRSGAALVNEVLLHFANSELPFGGFGDSGCGRYHGKHTFDTLTHKRAVMKSASRWYWDLPLRYAPYSPFVARLVDFATRLGW